MARRTSTPGNVPSSPTSSETQTLVAITETGSPSPPASDGLAPRRSSLTRLLSGLGSPHMGSSGIIERRPSPLPLLVEREETRVFDVGPRMSNNYRTVGFSLGGDLSAATGVSLGATISFETSGGTGALLLAKDPIHRHLLRHRAVLKAYFLAHRDYIYETFGQAEDVDIDDMALIYGQDCTSDWACAVTLEAERGSKVEFEVFSYIHTGVWGEWKTHCSASQRGPHRYQQAQESSRTPNQTIVVKRLTIQTRRFRPMKLKASAGPQSDDSDQDSSDRDGRGQRQQAMERFDPLKLVHKYLLEHSTALYSLASDDDAITLIKLVGTWTDLPDFQNRLLQAMKKHTSIVEDSDKTVMLQFTEPKEQSINHEIITQIKHHLLTTSISQIISAH